jgi:hypothetical protein
VRTNDPPLANAATGRIDHRAAGIASARPHSSGRVEDVPIEPRPDDGVSFRVAWMSSFGTSEFDRERRPLARLRVALEPLPVIGIAANDVSSLGPPGLVLRTFTPSRP